MSLKLITRIFALLLLAVMHPADASSFQGMKLRNAINAKRVVVLNQSNSRVLKLKYLELVDLFGGGGSLVHDSNYNDPFPNSSQAVFNQVLKNFEGPLYYGFKIIDTKTPTPADGTRVTLTIPKGFYRLMLSSYNNNRDGTFTLTFLHTNEQARLSDGRNVKSLITFYAHLTSSQLDILLDAWKNNSEPSIRIQYREDEY